MRRKPHNPPALDGELHALKLWRADDALGLMNGL